MGHHSVQTRLQTGAIQRKNYANFLALLPELSSLQLMDSIFNNPVMGHSSGGFSLLVDIIDI